MVKDYRQDGKLILKEQCDMLRNTTVCGIAPRIWGSTVRSVSSANCVLRYHYIQDMFRPGFSFPKVLWCSDELSPKTKMVIIRWSSWLIGAGSKEKLSCPCSMKIEKMMKVLWHFYYYFLPRRVLPFHSHSPCYSWWWCHQDQIWGPVWADHPLRNEWMKLLHLLSLSHL